MIDRLGATGHPAGFNTSSDMERFKRIWARVMSNPSHMPVDIVVEDEELREELGVARITRENMVKAYGESPKAKKIRAFIYEAHKGIKGDNKIKQGDEVEFKYTAKVLCIFRDGIQLPNTTSDLMNMGTAKQMLVAMKFSKAEGLGAHAAVPGRDGGENKRWAALAVHNQLQLARPVLGGERQRGGDNA